MLVHAGLALAVGAIVLTGSTGQTLSSSTAANNVGTAGLVDKTTSAQVVAKVAEQTNLLVTGEADTTAKTLGSQVNLPTTDDATLANRNIVNTAGATARGILTYSVQPSDTLASIASQFNITTDTIRWANGLAANVTLQPNQKLAILPISGVRYQVQAGDNAQLIASRYQSNADQILAFNNAEVSGIQAGQTIVVPDGVIQETVARTASTSTQTPAASTISSANKAAAGPNSYSYGYCTWYVANRRPVPSGWGNASAWYGNAQRSGYGVGSIPRVGAIAWSGAGYAGHVAYVESVSGGNVTVSEMNYNGWNRISSRTVPASTFRYIY